MDGNTFHIDHEGSALKPRFLVLMLGAVDLEGAPGEQQATWAASCPVICPAGADDPGLQREVAAFVAALPWEQRQALMLRLRHQLGYAEIAATLGCAEREARATVHDVLRSLRAHLGDRL